MSSLIAVLVLLAPPANPDVWIERRYDAFRSILSQNRGGELRRWVLEHTAPKFIYVSRDKNRFDRIGYAKGWVAHAGLVKKVIKCDYRVVISGQGSERIALVRSDFVASVVIEKSRLRLTDRSETRERWRKIGAGWKLVSINQTQAETQMFPE